jgi:hypothetical protein
MTETQLEKNWELLQNISDEMEDTTEEINKELRKIEESLIETKLGVSVWTNKTFHIITDNYDNEYKLGFCKYKREWKFVCRKFENDKFIGKMYPILEGNRIMRVKACQLITDLFIELVKKSKSFLDDTKKAKKQIEDTNIQEKIEELKKFF